MFNLLEVSVRNTPHFYGDLSKLNYFNGQKEDFIASRAYACVRKKEAATFATLQHSPYWLRCGIYSVVAFVVLWCL